jgi:hypothetical protein
MRARANTDPEAAKAARLIRKLGFGTAQQRVHVDELAAMGTPAVAPLLESWQSTHRLRTSLRIGGVAAYLTMGGVVFGGSAMVQKAWLISARAHDVAPLVVRAELAQGWLMATFIISMLPFSVAMWLVVYSGMRRQGIINAATRVADPRLVNIIAIRLKEEANPLLLKQASERDAVRNTLARILESLQLTDVNLLTPATRKTLVAWLKRQFSASSLLAAENDLVFAILKGLSTVGAVELRPVAEQIAVIDPPTPNAARLKEEAKLALARLDAWGDRERSGAVLLRGSASPASGSDVLVRAAGVTAESGSELLRANSDPPVEVRPARAAEEPQEIAQNVQST